MCAIVQIEYNVCKYSHNLEKFTFLFLLAIARFVGGILMEIIEIVLNLLS